MLIVGFLQAHGGYRKKPPLGDLLSLKVLFAMAFKEHDCSIEKKL